MAEFVEVMKQKRRMCEHYEYCINCPISDIRKRSEFCGAPSNMTNPQEAESIIMDWAKEHPVMTRKEKFKEIFGIEPNYGCPLFNTDECKLHNCDECHEDFWNQEWKNPKEKANEL